MLENFQIYIFVHPHFVLYTYVFVKNDEGEITYLY